MSQTVILDGGLFVLALVSGMLGIVVAFAAVPFLSFFMTDLVHQVQPLSLLLNGLTALSSTFAFARSGLVDWRSGVLLAVVTTVCAPVGAWLAQLAPVTYVWVVYLASVAYLAYRLLRPVTPREGREDLRLAMILAVPISVLSGFLGVGPGFLLVPALMLVGAEPRRAAAINALAVTPSSFSSLLPHMGTAQWDLSVAVPLLVAGATGSFLGARISARWVAGDRLRHVFAVLIVVVTGYKVAVLLNLA